MMCADSRGALET
jgi:hypothetical protein